jgi:hypothetical protein
MVHCYGDRAAVRVSPAILVAALAVALPLGAAEPARVARVLIDAGALPEAARGSLAALQQHSAVELVSPAPAETPQRDAILAGARRSYGNMAFDKAVSELSAVEASLTESARPSPERIARLAEVEMFLGACLLLQRDNREAEERFAFARALAPTLAPDPIFPPEVGGAVRAAKPGPPIQVEVAISPPEARLWIDGVAAADHPRLNTGLHYLVVERADRRPTGKVVRISKSTSRLELSAARPAAQEEAILALRVSSPTQTEGVAVSRLLSAPVWRLSSDGSNITAERWSAKDIVHPHQSVQVSAADPTALDKAICAIDACDPRVASSEAPKKPVWRRPWFWGAIGASAAVVLGGVIAGAVVGTRARDYEVVVR